MRTAEPDSSPEQINYFCRIAGTSICLCPMILMIASLVCAIGQPNDKWAGLIFAVPGLLIGFLNFYLSFVRDWLYRRKGGLSEEQRHLSGFPVCGTFLVVLAGILGFGEIKTSVIGLATLSLDTGGLPWFLIST